MRCSAVIAGTPMEEEFGVFFMACWDKLVRAVFAGTGDYGLAEDVAQETMMVIAETWGKYDRPNILMYKVARQRLSRMLQRQNKVPLQLRSFDSESADLQIRAGRAVRQGDSTDLRLDLESALLSLPVRQREVVVLSTICELEPSEIAEILGIHESTVKTHKTRGIKRVEQLMGNWLTSTGSGPEQPVGGL
jgi:RNA polymerase sigma factor (sigma-70 family)